MNSLPWHVGYFADEGEVYEWEAEEDDQEGDGLDRFDDLRRKIPDADDLEQIKGGKPQSTTSIAATPYGLAVIESLIADMQKQFGHSPQISGAGLKPIYAPNQVPGDLLAQVVASSETQITELQKLRNMRSQLQPRQEESQEGLYRRMLTAAYGHKTEIVVTTVATGALIFITRGGGGGALPAFARVVGPLAALFIKTGRHALAEADFQDKADNFDYAGQEMSEIGTV
jgi:hypothetical protein